MTALQDSRTRFFQLPPSPPSSTNVSAPSSPCIDHPSLPDDLVIPGSMPTLRRVKSQRLYQPQTLSETEEHTKPLSKRQPRKSFTRTAFSRSHILPSHHSLPTVSHLSSSSSRSRSPSASSSDLTSPSVKPPPPHPGIGRKVAASLDLFKESVNTPPTEEPNPFDRAPSVKRRVASVHPEQEAQPEFEFVKRSEWPDRESAAIRRDKSSTTLEKVRTRESISPSTTAREAADSKRRKERSLSIRENVINDLVQWRSEAFGDGLTGRGRPRQRGSSYDENQSSDDIERVSSHASLERLDGSILSRPYPPSPSPSRSPLTRAPLISPQRYRYRPRRISDVSTRLASPSSQHSPRLTSPLLPSAILSDIPSLPNSESTYSPWTTEDEESETSSNWDDDGSVISTSTASTHSVLPLSPYQSAPLSPPPVVRYSVHHDGDEDEDDSRLLTSSRMQQSGTPAHLGGLNEYLHHLSDTEIDEEADTQEAYELASTGDLIDFSHESLPHIPLRPFRNQVGGHSAIYKFTKRAVCKVRCVFDFRRLWPLFFFPSLIDFMFHNLMSSLSSLVKTSSMKLWNEKLHHYWGSSPDIWVSC